MAVLGCGRYDALILTRGGKEIVANPEWTQLSWKRILDDTSESSLTVDDNCIGQLGITRPWRHELSISRDGKQVWVGPIVAPALAVSDHTAWQTDARGISAWWDHRKIHEDHDYTLTPTDLATIFKAISDDAMSVDNSPGLFVDPSPSGILGALQILASQNNIAGPQLRDLANIGIDWTEVGRKVLCGGKAVPTESIGVLRDEDFAIPPAPKLDGLNQTNAWTVVGQGGGASGDAIFATSEDVAAGVLDGVLESVESVSTIQDFVSAKAAADSRLALTASNTVIERARLAPTAPVSIDQLVAGALCELDLVETANKIPVSGQFRLHTVDVTAASDGTEQVLLTFQPVGSVA